MRIAKFIWLFGERLIILRLRNSNGGGTLLVCRITYSNSYCYLNRTQVGLLYIRFHAGTGRYCEYKKQLYIWLLPQSWFFFSNANLSSLFATTSKSYRLSVLDEQWKTIVSSNPAKVASLVTYIFMESSQRVSKYIFYFFVRFAFARWYARSVVQFSSSVFQSVTYKVMNGVSLAELFFVILKTQNVMDDGLC